LTSSCWKVVCMSTALAFSRSVYIHGNSRQSITRMMHFMSGQAAAFAFARSVCVQGSTRQAIMKE